MNGIFKLVVFADFWMLFEVFQNISDWSQKVIGITNFQWGKFLAKIIFIAFTLDYIVCFFVEKTVISIICNTLFEVLGIVYFLYILKLCEQLDEKYVNGHKYQNERAITWVVYRIELVTICSCFFILHVFLVIGGANPWSIVFHGIGIGMIPICAYFISCTPLPPGESKVKVWLKNMNKKATEAFFPKPEPSQC